MIMIMIVALINSKPELSTVGIPLTHCYLRYAVAMVHWSTSLLAVADRKCGGLPLRGDGADAQFFNHGASPYFFGGDGAVFWVLGWW